MIRASGPEVLASSSSRSSLQRMQHGKLAASPSKAFERWQDEPRQTAAAQYRPSRQRQEHRDARRAAFSGVSSLPSKVKRRTSNVKGQRSNVKGQCASL